jgi:hypothetical protein
MGRDEIRRDVLKTNSGLHEHFLNVTIAVHRAAVFVDLALLKLYFLAANPAHIRARMRVRLLFPLSSRNISRDLNRNVFKPGR